jgi:hypothetical protein
MTKTNVEKEERYVFEGVDVLITARKLSAGRWHIGVVLDQLPALHRHTHDEEAECSSADEAIGVGRNMQRPKSVLFRQVFMTRS